MDDAERCIHVKPSGSRCRIARIAPDDPQNLWCVFHQDHIRALVKPHAYATGSAALDVMQRVSPMAALLEEIERTQLMVRWYESILADKEPEEMLTTVITESRIGGPGGDYDLTRTEERPHPALQLLNQERAHLANITRLAIQSGIEARQLELNESMANTLITAMQGFARLAGFDPTSAAAKTMMAEAMRAAREGRVVETSLVQDTPALEA